MHRSRNERRRSNLIRIREDYCGGSAAELARRIGKSPTYISRMLFEPGKKGARGISEETTDIIERVFGLPRHWMDEGHNDSKQVDISGMLPVIKIESIKKWQDTKNKECIEMWIPVPVVHSSGSFAVRVSGPSMEPRFSDGDIIVVDPQKPAEPDKFVLAGPADHSEAKLRQLIVENGTKYLKCLNGAWPIPIMLMPESWVIIGAVICKIDIL